MKYTVESKSGETKTADSMNEVLQILKENPDATVFNENGQKIVLLNE